MPLVLTKIESQRPEPISSTLPVVQFTTLHYSIVHTVHCSTLYKAHSVLQLLHKGLRQGLGLFQGHTLRSPL